MLGKGTERSLVPARGSVSPEEIRQGSDNLLEHLVGSRWAGWHLDWYCLAMQTPCLRVRVWTMDSGATGLFI